MNKFQRKELKEAIQMMESAKEIIERIAEEQQDKFDNLTEGLQATEKNQLLEQEAESLNDIASELEDLSSRIDSVMEGDL